MRDVLVLTESKIPKSSRHFVRVSVLLERDGSLAIDVRVCNQIDGAATVKGLSVRPSMLGSLIAALTHAERTILEAKS